eukprot:GILJ01003981.1.p1 GENE.GILJ01003981.1~~GILJ01003981.1.p1  ORF type:complete len:103 (-),score=5.85 GILJ01003981.1:396-704(-)
MLDDAIAQSMLCTAPPSVPYSEEKHYDNATTHTSHAKLHTLPESIVIDRSCISARRSCSRNCCVTVVSQQEDTVSDKHSAAPRGPPPSLTDRGRRAYKVLVE